MVVYIGAFCLLFASRQVCQVPPGQILHRLSILVTSVWKKPEIRDFDHEVP